MCLLEKESPETQKNEIPDFNVGAAVDNLMGKEVRNVSGMLKVLDLDPELEAAKGTTGSSVDP